MQHTADSEFAVLHALRLKGLADTPTIAVCMQLPVEEVERALGSLACDELVVRRDGRLSGWSLSEAGRARHACAVAEEVGRAGIRGRVEDVYKRFLPVNRALLEVCTDWQVRGTVLNDHADAAYDAAVLARLDAVDAAVQPLCAELGGILPRFGCYVGRLAAARARVHEGDVDWFTKPMIDSYHSIWFELHEDLLSTLGIERSKEEPS